MPMPFPRRRLQPGFTLIELIIAVAIIGILVRIAYPAFTQQLRKARRAEAKAALLDLASREERYMSTANQYTSTPLALGFSSSASFPMAILAGSSSFYTLNVVTSSPYTSYTASAVATGTQVADKCGNFTINSSGVQGVTGTSTAADCW